ncbi:MAG: DinB family protein [Actinomycetota bacterium]
MDGDSLLAFVRYHAWANDRILTTAADLSDNDLRKDGVLDHGSAFQTIRQLVDVDWSWREFCIGNDVGETYVWDHGFTLEDLSARTRSASRRTCGSARSSSRSTTKRSPSRGALMPTSQDRDGSWSPTS